MKIGTLTLPLWYNYGGIIQAYVLQRILAELGHEASLIDFHHPIPSSFQLFRNKLVRGVKKYLFQNGNTVIYPDYYQRQIISKHTLEFINKEIQPITEKVYSYDELKKIEADFEAFIVGSDQVWRPNYTPNIENYFLDFTDKIKIAYAASLGTDVWQYSEAQHEICKSLIQKFRAVSVREKSALSICKDKFATEAIQVLDPTMLLTKHDYLELCSKYDTPPNTGNLFTYILDESDRNKTIIDQVSEVLNLQAFRVMPKPFDDQFQKDDAAYVFPPLTQWLKAFDDAEFIVADSFHGCVFAIIFNKPFIAIGNKERGLTRFQSLFEMFHLADRLILSPDDLTEDLINAPIDWLSVNAILDANKNSSLEFLKTNLE
ncbi:polysaccharide pyruvyl transferase family protein [Ancylomarina salipaludis]|uniref:Polysaccharide pyruvyl transferase family protein n=1 Tax=Ancylomarina salipaludis TaxID=2501299 RepID=A0A4Q1JQG2_9BACT|nr:polysaccharide pyruvyl transferase family protein [Ancylomarina salipaludis]RXQ97448.1 polysaccharide pyruvyl transferase family protein [Ancylomarina salipaludis]